MALLEAFRADVPQVAAAPLDSTPSPAAPQSRAARPFLAIYGSPPPPPPPAAAPVAQPAPLDYTLKGVVASGEMRWAILSRPGGDLLVREGDVLESGVSVAQVHAEGVDLMRDGQRIALGFDAEAPVLYAEIESPAPEAEPEATDPGFGKMYTPDRQAVLFQEMTPAQLQEMLAQAEANRQERGWVANDR